MGVGLEESAAPNKIVGCAEEDGDKEETDGAPTAPANDGLKDGQPPT